MVDRIYIASKSKHAGKWRDLRRSGIPIISTWIDEAGEGESGDLSSLAYRCIDEARTSDVLIAYAEEGETHAGAYVEIGAALAAGSPVIAIGPVIKLNSAFRHHPLWHECSTIIDALNLIEEQALLQLKKIDSIDKNA